MQDTLMTRLGRLRGTVAEGGARPVALYRGIPYAEPPTRPRRLDPPAPPRPWTGTRDAVRAAPAPAQLPDPLAVLPGLNTPQTSEDCLTLDVCAPVGAKDRPVMVWIPGGGFTTGGTAAPTYDLRTLAAEGDVVVVSVNYRLGIVGFAALGDHANLGLQDQLAALRWVQDHIDAFGGDPSSVTVFGESAGGGSIMHVLTCPAREGLFGRAIVQSGATDLTLSKAQAEAVGERLRAALGARDWRTVGVEQVLEVQAAATLELAALVGGMPYHPWVDGEVVTARPIDGLGDGVAAGVDLLIGTTRDEIHLFVDIHEPGVDQERLRRRVTRYLEGRHGRSEAAVVERVLGVHAAAGGTPQEQWSAVRTEAEMRGPALSAAIAQSQYARTFVYEFGWPATGAFRGLGACHALDLPFTFGTTGEHGWPDVLGTGAGPADLSALIRRAWVAFAVSGDPSHDALGRWPAYSADRRATMVLDGRPRVEDDPRAAMRQVWEEVRGRG